MTIQLPGPREDQISADLELNPIDERSWRICDTRWRDDDAPHVVAYVELVEGAYDVVWMRGARRRSRLGSLEECLRSARKHVAQEVESGTRPVRIPHFPPPRRG